MNVLAGLMIGWLNDEWLARLTIPFAWAALWCLQKWLVQAHRRFEAERHGQVARLGMSHRLAFYVIEFNTAAVTSLVFSVIVGAIRAWLGK
jgi:hypothetical protein